MEAGTPIAVCSTSNERAVSTIVRVLLGPEVAAKMRVYAGDVVPKKKPAPDIYLLAAKELGVDPRMCAARFSSVYILNCIQIDILFRIILFCFILSCIISFCMFVSYISGFIMSPACGEASWRLRGAAVSSDRTHQGAGQQSLSWRHGRTPPARRCVVVEDSRIGQRAAHDAGMRCVVTKSRYTEDEDFDVADAVFDCIGDAGDERFSLHDLTTPGARVPSGPAPRSVRGGLS